MKTAFLVLAVAALGAGLVLAAPGAAATPCDGSMLDADVLVACASWHVQQVRDQVRPPPPADDFPP